MHDLRESSWWSGLVERLETESLNGLAHEFDVSPDDVETALADLDPGEAITATPAWPEIVRRIQGGGSLRDTARRFRTSPRRIRRGLARAALRVGGVAVGNEGLPALSDVLEELGQVPDGVLARQCGVTVEAVQGERRRRGIDAFRPAPLPPRKGPRRGAKPAPERRPKAQKVWQREAVDTQVVHRTSRRRAPAPPPRTNQPVSGFAKGLRLPLPKASSASTTPTYAAGERGWSAPPKSAEPEGGRRRVRRRVVRSDADPIAAALGQSSKSVDPPAAGQRPATRTTRRRRVTRRSTGGGDSSSEPPSGTKKGSNTVGDSTPALASPAPKPSKISDAAVAVRSERRKARKAASAKVSRPPKVSASPKVSPPSVAPAATIPASPEVRVAPSVSTLSPFPARRGGLPTVGLPGIPRVPSVVSATPSRVRAVSTVTVLSVPAPAPVEAPVETESSTLQAAPDVVETAPATQTQAKPVAKKAAAPSKPKKATASKAKAAKKSKPKKAAAASKRPKAKQAKPKAVAKAPVAKAPVTKAPVAKAPVAVKPAPKAAPAPPVSAHGPLLADINHVRSVLRGGRLVTAADLKVTTAGVHGTAMPEIWRARAGNKVLPIVVLANGMFDAIVLVQPHLSATQLQSLSVWSDGPLA